MSYYFEFDGKQYTKASFCKQFNIGQYSFDRMKNRHMTYQEMIERVKGRGMPLTGGFKYKNKWYGSINQACKDLGLTHYRVTGLVKGGQSPIKAIEYYLKRREAQKTNSTYKGVTYRSFFEACKYTPYCYQVLSFYRKPNLTLDEIVEAYEKNKSSILIELNGKKYKSIREIAREYNKDYSNVLRLVNKGVPLEIAVQKRKRGEKLCK